LLLQYDRINEIQLPVYNECIKDIKPNQNESDNDKHQACLEKQSLSVHQKYTGDEINHLQANFISNISNYYKNNIFFIDFWDKHSSILSLVTYPKYTTLKDFNQIFTNNNKDNSLFSPDGHPNKLGHQLIADIIYDKLFELNQIPCQSLEQK